jgi:hypothetical protein
LIYDQSSERFVKDLEKTAKFRFTNLSDGDVLKLKENASESFRKHAMKGIRSVSQEKADEYQSIVEDLTKEHGQEEALKKLVAYLVMNPLERTTLSSSSSYERNSYSNSNNAPRDNHRRRSDEDEDEAPETYSKSTFSRNRTSHLEENNQAVEVPDNLYKSVFMSGIESEEHLEMALKMLSIQGITLEVSVYKEGKEDKKGFAFLTPESAKDFKSLIQLRSISLDDGNVYFRKNMPK